MKIELKTIIVEKDIVVLETPINNDVIYNLQAHDDFDEQLNFVIKAYVAWIEDNENIEIYQVGNSYFITEHTIYIAVYQDDLNEETLKS